MEAIKNDAAHYSADLFHPDNVLAAALANFNKQLNREPADDEIASRRFSRWNPKTRQKEPFDYLYLPIGIVENKLMEVFGWFETRNFTTHIVANEVIGSVELHVYHPIFKRMVCSTGTAAVMITQKSGSTPTDIDAKIMNALETAAPHLLSDCIANAAKRFGKAFGRDLNREWTDEYDPDISSSLERLEQMEKERAVLEQSAQALKTAQDKINAYTDAAELFNNSRGIADKAIAAGLMDIDLEALRTFFTAKHNALLAQKELAQPEEAQEPKQQQKKGKK